MYAATECNKMHCSTLQHSATPFFNDTRVIAHKHMYNHTIINVLSRVSLLLASSLSCCLSCNDILVITHIQTYIHRRTLWCISLAFVIPLVLLFLLFCSCFSSFALLFTLLLSCSLSCFFVFSLARALFPSVFPSHFLTELALLFTRKLSLSLSYPRFLSLSLLRSPLPLSLSHFRSLARSLVLSLSLLLSLSCPPVLSISLTRARSLSRSFARSLSLFETYQYLYVVFVRKCVCVHVF